MELAISRILCRFSTLATKKTSSTYSFIAWPDLWIILFSMYYITSSVIAIEREEPIAAPFICLKKVSLNMKQLEDIQKLINSMVVPFSKLVVGTSSGKISSITLQVNSNRIEVNRKMTSKDAIKSFGGKQLFQDPLKTCTMNLNCDVV